MKLNKRRRLENKTNYTKRLRLLRDNHKRFIARKTNRYLILQIVESKHAQDKVIYSVNTKELLKYGFPKENLNSLKSIPAAYLGGYLLGKKIKDLKEMVILDSGLIANTKGSRIYAAVKGLNDAGIKINYDISRVKACDSYLIFVHGAGGDLTAWKKERVFFHRKGISTIALDLRGHGKSEKPSFPADYNLKNFAKDVHCVLNKEKVINFILVGHCFGGVVTIMFHKLFPKLARSYILIDTTYKAPNRLRSFLKHHPFCIHLLNHILINKGLHKKHLHKKHFSHANYKKFVGTEDLNFLRIYSDIIHTSFKSWIFTYEKLANFNGTKILKGIKKRVLIIEGEKDSIFDVLKAKKIHNLIKNSKLEIIPNANHIIVLNNPKILEKNIYQFINSIKGFIKK